MTPNADATPDYANATPDNSDATPDSADAAPDSADATVDDAEAARAHHLSHGQVCYLQLPAADPDRAAAFYQAVFGWVTEHPYLDFVSPGLIGQWVPDRPPAADTGPTIWIHVADLDQALSLVVAHGGTVTSPPEPDGPSRTLATILDSEGNPIGLAAHAPPPEPSS